MDPTGNYAQSLFSNPPNVIGLFNTIVQNYINDKIGILTFELSEDDATIGVDFGVNEITAFLFNNFFQMEVFQPVIHEYTQEEIDAGFSLILIYTTDGGLFKPDFSNIAFEIPIDLTTYLPIAYNFTKFGMYNEDVEEPVSETLKITIANKEKAMKEANERLLNMQNEESEQKLGLVDGNTIIIKTETNFKMTIKK
jgi:hypothetical protein